MEVVWEKERDKRKTRLVENCGMQGRNEKKRQRRDEVTEALKGIKKEKCSCQVWQWKKKGEKEQRWEEKYGKMTFKR